MGDRMLNIGLIPLDIEPMDAEANVAEVCRRIESLPENTDLIVLPEMFSTGFTAEEEALRSVAENTDGPTISVLRKCAIARNAAICGSIIANDEEGRFFNQGFIIDPDSDDISYYRKRHLFRYGGESRIFTAGDQLAPTVEFRSWKLKMSLCYDIRFPVWNRNVDCDYDVLIVPANWAHSRFYAWKHLLIARAIENQCYVLGCNREGEDIYGSYERGDTLAFDYWGKSIGETMADGTLLARIDREALLASRDRFSPWRDADTFTIVR